MNDWKAGGLGALGTLATIIIDHFNATVAALCGLLTLALLARKCFFAFRTDLRGVLARWSNHPPRTEDPAKRPPDEPGGAA